MDNLMSNIKRKNSCNEKEQKVHEAKSIQNLLQGNVVNKLAEALKGDNNNRNMINGGGRNSPTKRNKLMKTLE